MVGWHHQLDGHKFEQTLGVGDGQGGLACCSPWGHKESDTTERLNSTETVAPQAPLSMRFPRQAYQSGLPVLTPGDLPDSQMRSHWQLLHLLCRQVGSLPLCHMEPLEDQASTFNREKKKKNYPFETQGYLSTLATNSLLFFHPHTL